MTDTDIMKNVRCCADHYCKGCSLQGKGNCKETLLSFAWNTMYNQKEEIERLRNESDELAEQLHNLLIEKDDLFDETERLIKTTL